MLKWRASHLFKVLAVVYACGLIVSAVQITRWQNLRAKISACALNAKLSRGFEMHEKSDDRVNSLCARQSIHMARDWGLDQLINIHPEFADKKLQQSAKAATKPHEVSCNISLTFEQVLRVLQLADHPGFEEWLKLSKLTLEPSGSSDNTCRMTLGFVKRQAK